MRLSRRERWAKEAVWKEAIVRPWDGCVSTCARHPRFQACVSLSLFSARTQAPTAPNKYATGVTAAGGEHVTGVTAAGGDRRR
jgi:hypothetical protein